MVHDIQYFRLEIDKVRTRAINRAWSAPPRRDAQTVFRADVDPQSVSIDAWANALLHIEAKHGIPLTISGGGYGCFSFSVATLHSDAERLVRAVETAPDVQRLLDQAGASSMEVWKHEGDKSTMETLVPAASYPCIIATNRQIRPQLLGGRTSVDIFGNDEGENLIAGQAKIWVYDPRTAGQRPSPWERVWRRWVTGSRALSSIGVEHSDVTIGELPDLIEAIQATSKVISPRSRLTVFVHGYNQPISAAVEAVGRLVHNVRFDQIGAIPIIYCWPSRGALQAYFSDGERAAGSELKLRSLLERIIATKGRPIVDVLAHSHGCQLTLRSFVAFSRDHAATVRNLIFVAPDVHNSLFSEYLPQIEEKVDRITLYFSLGDLALWVSSVFKTARLGSQPRLPDRSRNLDVIDASFVKAYLLGHSYHIGSPEVHEDIRGLFDGNPPAQRRLLQKDREDTRKWRIQPTH